MTHTHTHRWSLILCVDSKQCAGQAFGDAGSKGTLLTVGPLRMFVHKDVGVHVGAVVI